MKILLFSLLSLFFCLGHEISKAVPSQIVPQKWFYLGPFLIAPREGISGVDEDELKFSPDTTKIYPSVLAQGGYVSFKKAEIDTLGFVSLSFPEVLWDTLLKFYGVANLLNLSYAYSEIVVEEECRGLVMAEGVGSFFLNGLGFIGDPYAHGFLKIPVLLRKGKNSILVKVSGFGERRFKFIILPPRDLIEIIKEDITKPDLIKEEEKETVFVHLGIPLLNTTQKRFKKLSLRVALPNSEIGEEKIIDLMPFNTTKVPISLKVNKKFLLDTVLKLTLTVKEETNGIELVDSIHLMVKKERKSHKVTFISRIDNSCQYFAIQYPKNFDPEKRYALIFSLHGAGVEAIGLVNCYSQKDWAFVVCPTNRRPYGFDWEDWGYLDAVEVLEYVIKNYPIDTNRIYLTGHSMGGHGCWVLGLLKPHLFAAIAPGAGWITHKMYVPWLFQRSEIFSKPELLSVREKVLKTYHALYLLENAKNLPIFIFHGGLDDNVPPIQSRFFHTHLKDLNYNYIYKEVAGVGHWYELPSTKTICVDDPEMMEFFKNHTRDPFPKKVTFKTYDLDIANRAYWIEILSEINWGDEIKINAEVKDCTIKVFTENVKALRIFLTPEIQEKERFYLSINSHLKSFSKKEEARKLDLLLGRKGKWQVKKEVAKRWRGPMKKSYFAPFVLVYATKSETAEKITYHQALRESYIWWRHGNGFVSILPDTEITKEIINNYNLIIFGGEAINYFSEKICQGLPFRVKKGELFFKKRNLGRAKAYRFCYLNPLNKKKTVLISDGTDLEMVHLSTFFSVLTSASGLPDFIVLSKKVRKEGWGGLVDCGFFE